MEQVNLRLEHVRLLVITHAHADHYGQAATIVERAGCELWMHPNHEHATRAAQDPEAALAAAHRGRAPGGVPRAARGVRYEAARRGQGFGHRRRSSSRTAPLLPGVEVRTDLGAWLVVETPGHAPSHVCLFQPERRMLISGDHLLGRISLYYDYGYSPDPVGEFLRLARRRSRPRHAALPARPRAHVHRRRRAHRRPTARSSPSASRAACARCASSGPITAFEAVPAGPRRATDARERRAGGCRRRSATCAISRSPGRAEREPGDGRRAGALARLQLDRPFKFPRSAACASTSCSRRRPAGLLLRVLPAEDRGGPRQPLRRRRRAALARPDYVSVTYGAGGSTRDKTIEIVSRIKEEYGIEAMPHFTCVGATVDELRDDARRDGGGRLRQRARAARRPARRPGGVDQDRGRPRVLARARRADPRRLPASRSARRASPRRTSTRRAPRTTSATSRRRSTPASTS